MLISSMVLMKAWMLVSIGDVDGVWEMGLVDIWAMLAPPFPYGIPVPVDQRGEAVPDPKAVGADDVDAQIVQLSDQGFSRAQSLMSAVSEPVCFQPHGTENSSWRS